MKLKVEFLYFNKTACERCKATDENIRKSLKGLKDVLKKSNVEFELVKRRLGESRLKKSPTILINGRDIESVVGRRKAPQKSVCSPCSACSKLVGRPSSCRSFSYEGKSYDAVPKAMIRKAVELSLKRSAKQ